MTAQATAPVADIDTFEANARASGALDSEGFFAQDDWEFDLDQIPRGNVVALQDHLTKAPVASETAAFLKGYLQGGRTHFTAFD
ncbi:hypothetical protein ABIC83_002645 [Roseateles asaccharophilus]|uniref:hypothetical protein n=1 Tax=Roseateles asaccharophilus TaxID=582607 RepID=UPI00383393DE